MCDAMKVPHEGVDGLLNALINFMEAPTHTTSKAQFIRPALHRETYDDQG